MVSMVRFDFSPRLLAASLLGCCLVAAPLYSAHAQMGDAKPAVGTKVSPADAYGKLMAGMEKEFVDLAEAMPEDKYSFAPTAGEFKGVRTFGDQVKHIAEANYYFFGGDMTEAQTKAMSDKITALKTKAEIVAALKESFGVAHKYIGAITDANDFVMTAHGTPGGQAAFGMAHMMDHYGQMVVYARMNSVVPPASRGN
jgi:hypothetical protein